MADAVGSLPILVDACDSATPPGGYPLGGQTQVNVRNQHMQYIITWYLSLSCDVLHTHSKSLTTHTHPLTHSLTHPLTLFATGTLSQC